jgi:hypothetical protein
MRHKPQREKAENPHIHMYVEVLYLSFKIF